MNLGGRARGALQSVNVDVGEGEGTMSDRPFDPAATGCGSSRAGALPPLHARLEG